MKNKYAFENGERRPNEKCICSLEDKSKCFKEFVIVPEREDRHKRKYKEESYWRIICPQLNEISRKATEGAEKMLNGLFH